MTPAAPGWWPPRPDHRADHRGDQLPAAGPAEAEWLPDLVVRAIPIGFRRLRADAPERCVIGVTQHIDQRTVALNLPRVLQAARDDISTDIPLQDLYAWVTLTLQVKTGHVCSLPFTNVVVRSANPNFVKIHTLVRNAITAATAKLVPLAATEPGASPPPGVTGRHPRPRWYQRRRHSARSPPRTSLLSAERRPATCLECLGQSRSDPLAVVALRLLA